MQIMNRILYIFYDDAYTPKPELIGTLESQLLRGKEVFSFEFSEEWLQSTRCRMLDPELQLYAGRQYLMDGKSNFGIFLDSTPDRWGRVLMERRESIRAEREQRVRKILYETDFLLGVHDETRMGALRIKSDICGDFLDNDMQWSAPPITSLAELEQASWALEQDDTPQMRKWLQILLAPGSSLGGARPKANVRNTDGRLWIAKFPSRNDKANIGAWEALTMELAQRCGIRVAPFAVKYMNNKHAIFLTQRFDRDEQGRRVHFTSAMTMLGYNDGESQGASYLELADWISRYCCSVEDNLLELFKRIVFNIAVSNCDDHLRNHGFILTRNGWTLSPAYDLNPQHYGMGLSLNINEKDNRLDYDLAMEVAPYFGLSIEQAKAIVDKTMNIVASWRQLANAYHIPREEQEQMASAFEYRV
jgi:serine/threonine-protein kinase HipA